MVEMTLHPAACDILRRRSKAFSSSIPRSKTRALLLRSYVIRTMELGKSFHDTLVGDVYDIIIAEPSVVREGTGIKDAIDAMLRNPLTHRVYVVDNEGRLKGVVTTGALLNLLGYKVGVRGMSALSFYRFMRDALGNNVGAVRQSITPVKRETRVVDALNLMIKNQWDALPVVDDDNRLVGELVSLELFVKGKELF